jgi:hypothetical protein
LKNCNIIILLFSLIGCSNQKKLEQLTIKEPVLPPPSFNVEIANYCPESNAKRVSFLTVNRNYHLTSSSIVSDIDGDGIIDSEERSELGIFLNISPTKYDNAAKYYSDAIFYNLLMSPEKQAELTPCTSLDTDNEGLPDCAEYLIGTNPSKQDTDQDGVSDELELFFGTNPLQQDMHLDSDFDGVSNFQELTLGTPYLEKNTRGIISVSTLNYTLASEEEGKNCFHYTVKNIPYNISRAENNVIEFYFAEQIGAEISFKKFTRTIDEATVMKANESAEVSTFKWEYSDLLKQKGGSP